MTRKRLVIPLLASVLALASPAGAQDDENDAAPRAAFALSDVRPVMKAVLENIIRPGYADFDSATANLQSDVAALCADPSDNALRQARAAFSNTALAWAGIEMVRFGPVAEDNRYERVLFFPDRKGTGLRQVRALLAEKDETATTRESLTGKSVALQGLGALEFVLFGTGSNELAAPDNAFRCGYASAIADNLDTIAGELVAAWAKDDGIAKVWTEPGGGNPVFRDGREALNEVLGIAVHGIEMVRDTRLANLVDENPKRDKPKRALFWRSQNTIPVAIANLKAIHKLFVDGDMETLLPEQFAMTAGSIDFEFGSAIGALERIDQPIAEVLDDPDKRGAFLFALLTLHSLKDRLAGEYGSAVGLTAGFSFSDGD